MWIDNGKEKLNLRYPKRLPQETKYLKQQEFVKFLKDSNLKMYSTEWQLKKERCIYNTLKQA